MGALVKLTEDMPGKRILIVEDEPLLAMVLEEVLLDDGFKIAGVAGRLKDALDMIAADLCDAAILDAGLAGVSSAPAAMALKALGLPFVVLSGSSAPQQLPAFQGAVHLLKPCSPDRLLNVLHTMVADSVLPNREIG